MSQTGLSYNGMIGHFQMQRVIVARMGGGVDFTVADNEGFDIGNFHLAASQVMTMVSVYANSRWRFEPLANTRRTTGRKCSRGRVS